MNGVGNWARVLSEAAQRAIPIDVAIEITHHCNFRCQHCYIPDFQAPDLLSTERIFRLLDELAEMGTLFLTLTGGELFLRRDWITIARQARRLGFNLRLLTNGSLIDQGTASAIRELTAAVEISLYSMEPEVFEAITQRPGSFADTLAGVERLRALGVEVLLKVPIMSLNRGATRRVLEYAQSLGAQCQAFPTIMAKKDGSLATLGLRLPYAQARPDLLGGPVTGCASDPRGESRDGPLCAAASRYCCITSAGDVMACNILPGSGGNLREHSFREIWERSPWLNEVRSIRRGDLRTCGTCAKLSYCGRCHAQALVEDGDLYGPSSYARSRAEELERGRRSGGRGD